MHQRIAWCYQITEALVHVHSHGVVHQDLRPRNVLVHETTPGARDLLLCDFGGSACGELGLDGRSLPDGPFYDPELGDEASPALDIFGLGAFFYTVLTGCWPWRSSPAAPLTLDERDEYDRLVSGLLRQRMFPGVAGLVGDPVMTGCWTRRYETAQDVLDALRLEMPIPLADRTELDEDPPS